MNRQREDVTKVAAESEVKRLMSLDTTPWYQKKNLRQLYVFLIPAVLGVEMTSGYDGNFGNLLAETIVRNTDTVIRIYPERSTSCRPLDQALQQPTGRDPWTDHGW
jgi:hypothetical protein